MDAIEQSGFSGASIKSPIHHARITTLVAILSTLASGVLVHARQELTPAAVAETQARAGQGDADAQYELGIMHAEGRGVPQNDAVAVR